MIIDQNLIEQMPNEILAIIVEKANCFGPVRLVERRFNDVVSICFDHLNADISKRFPHFSRIDGSPFVVLKSLIQQISKEEKFYEIITGNPKKQSLHQILAELPKRFLRIEEKQNELRNGADFAFVRQVNAVINPGSQWGHHLKTKREVNKKWEEIKASAIRAYHPVACSGFDAKGLYFLSNKLFCLINLKILTISGSLIRSIPDEISRLTSLTELCLYNNPVLTHIPFDKLTSLEKLTLKKTKSEVLNDSITKLTNLANLYLSLNGWNALPACIAELTHLKVLDLSNNNLVDLPENFLQLNRLEVLSILGNELTSFPLVITQLSGLRSLDLSFNRIKTFPQDLSFISRLEHLAVNGNQIRHIPPDVLKRAAEHTLELNDSSQVITLTERMNCSLV